MGLSTKKQSNNGEGWSYIKKYINWEIVLFLLVLQWLLTPYGLKNPEELVMERMLLGIMILGELIITWRNLIQTRTSYMFYVMLIGLLLSVLVFDLYMQGLFDFASVILSIMLPLIYEQYRKNFKTGEESSAT